MASLKYLPVHPTNRVKAVHVGFSRNPRKMGLTRWNPSKRAVARLGRAAGRGQAAPSAPKIRHGCFRRGMSFLRRNQLGVLFIGSPPRKKKKKTRTSRTRTKEKEEEEGFPFCFKPKKTSHPRAKRKHAKGVPHIQQVFRHGSPF